MAINLTHLPVDCLDLIFLQLSFNELNSISRTCNYLQARVENFKNRYVDEYHKKLEDYNRYEQNAQVFDFDQDETDDTEGDGNFLVDFDDHDIDDFLETDDDDAEDIDDFELDGFGDDRSYGSGSSSSLIDYADEPKS